MNPFQITNPTEVSRPTKENIRQLIENQRMKTYQNRRRLNEQLERENELNSRIFLQAQESYDLLHDIHNIEIGRFQSNRLRQLKNEITQVMNNCLQSGRIRDIRRLGQLMNPQLEEFLNELKYFREGFKPDFIKKIPFFLYKKEEEKDEKDDCCSICYTIYQENVECIKLGCNHIFHRQCISKWLGRKPNCPLCKKEVKPIRARDPPANNDQNMRVNSV